MKNPTISINLTTYNRAHLLPRAIEGILMQTFTNWELIVVDDASTDGTKKLLKSYAKKDKRIKPLFHNENKGNATTRNTALKNSSGEYIAFLDDDDEWTSKHNLNNQLDIFKSSTDPRLVISCAGINIINSDGNLLIKKTVKSPKNLHQHILKGNGIIFSPTVMSKRSLMVAVGGFDENMSRGVDSEFYRTCIIKHNLKVHFSKGIGANYHSHSGTRLTPTNTLRATKNSLKAQAYLLCKYLPEYVEYPQAALTRLKIIGANLLSLPIVILRNVTINEQPN